MQIVIIGGGIVGLHIAAALADAGKGEVYLLDKEDFLGHHTSGRNSGVIHAGIFYKTGSFKESICIEGNAKTYEWADKLGVPHLRCGKWVVPEEDQDAELEPFFEKISALPVPKPRIVSVTELKEIEPLLRPSRAILVPSTGMIDASDYIRAMVRYVESKGVMVVNPCKVTGVKNGVLETDRGEMPFDLVINSAGLQADEVATMAGLTGYTIKPCRGDYYCISKAPISKPVYHLPYKDAHGLGVHLTVSVAGELLMGPNAYFIDGKEDYAHRSDPAPYQHAVEYFLPNWKHPPLQVSYAGNRPKLYKDSVALPEFTIVKRDAWIHLLGIESPGLTSAPALARHVVEMI